MEASLIAQLVKNPPAMLETSVRFLGEEDLETSDRFLGEEDPLAKGKATHSSIPAWRIPWTVHGVAKSQARLNDFHFNLGRIWEN